MFDVFLCLMFILYYYFLPFYSFFLVILFNFLLSLYPYFVVLPY